ncbi:MAG TPA: hypothetical protein VD908_07780 [Cytophagales bacterium]|nr:hypothetical protein [Cytophagales bacterium]
MIPKLNYTQQDRDYALIYSVVFTPMLRKINNINFDQLTEGDKMELLKELLEAFNAGYTNARTISKECYWLFYGTYETLEWAIFEHCSADTIEKWNFYLEFAAQQSEILSNRN